MNISIRTRFIIIGLLLSFGSTAFWEIYFIEHGESLLKAELNERVSALLSNLAMNSPYGVLTMNKDDLSRLAHSTLQQKDIYAVRITSKAGIPLVTLKNSGAPKQWKEYAMPIESAAPSATTDENIVFDLSGSAAQEEIGSVAITVSLDSLNRKISELRRTTMIIMGAITLLLIIVVMAVIKRYLIAPIDDMIVATRSLAQGNLSYRIPIRARDEMGMLAAFFNRMTEELEASKKKIDDYNNALELKVEERTRELRESQNKLIQTSKLSAIGQLAGGVAHEINNPMAIILGFSQVVIKDIKENNPLYMPLKSIEREAIRCKKLVGDLLTFSRVAKSDKENTDIHDLIEHTLPLIEAQAKMKNVIINREFDHSVPNIPLNKNQIQQVIVNLCNNAIDAMPKGGTITIATAMMGKIIEIRVTDTGIGMPEEVKQHIFEAFFTTKDVGKGTGLGLSLCYEIIHEKHNGTIAVESETGKGTKFIIQLPIV